MLAAATLSGAVTAYCGPIAFLGIAAPHLARGLLGTADHRLPLNTTMALLGAPVVGWALIRLGRHGRQLEV